MKKNIPLIILAIACIVAGLFLAMDTHNEAHIHNVSLYLLPNVLQANEMLSG